MLSNHNKKSHLKILVIGRSGSGKTTFINSLVNHFFNKSYSSPRLFAITQNLSVTNVQTNEPVCIQLACNIPNFLSKQSDNAASQSKSQTAKPNIYDLQNALMKLTIVDTPGLGDTAGLQNDRAHSEKICQAAAALTDFNAVVFIHRASDCRKDVMLSYMIREFQGILPKDCQKNFIVCFTGAANPRKIDALQALKEMDIPIDKYFAFENDYLIPKDAWLSATGIGDSPQLSSKFASTLKRTENFWEDAKESFGELISHILSLIPMPGKSLLELSLKRKIIRKLMADNSDRFTDAQRQLVRLDIRKQELQDLHSKAHQYSGYEKQTTKFEKKIRYTTQTVTKERDIAPGKATQCLICQNLCHNPCHLDQVYSKGHISLQGCTAMARTDTCIRDACKHSYLHHWHTQSIKEAVVEQIPEEYLEEVTLNEVDQAMKDKYLETKKSIPEIENLVTQLCLEVTQLQAELNVLYRKISYLHKQLDDTTLHAKNEFFLQYLDYKRTMILSAGVAIQMDKRLELDYLQRAEIEYLNLKKIIESTPDWSLDHADLKDLEKQLDEQEMQMRQVIQSYQGDRGVFFLNETMFLPEQNDF